MLQLLEAMIAKRIQLLTPSPTLSLDAKVKSLQSQGNTIINLSVGEPDFDTPQAIQTAAYRAMQEGFTHYTLTAGMIELRKAIAEKFLKDNHISYDPSEVIVGMGSKPLLYLAFQALLDKGDEVIVPIPTWNTYVEQIKLAEGTPVFITLQPPFKLTAKDVERKITKKTKALLINSPSNPTGAMIEKNELHDIAELAVKHNFIIISDEIYEKITYTGNHISIASLDSNSKERTLTINGFSKAYAMTGWRIGYAGGPKEIIQAMVNLQGQITSSVASFVQIAGIEALRADQQSVNEMATEFAKRRAYVLDSLQTIPELSLVEPEGAFYFFVSIEKLLGSRYRTSAEWCEALLEIEKIAVVPGEGFFYPGYFRLSYAANMDALEKGIEGIRKFAQH